MARANLTPIGMIGTTQSSGPSVTLIGIADPQVQGGGAAISAVNAKVGIDGAGRPARNGAGAGICRRRRA